MNKAVPQDARLAMNAMEPLVRLREELSNPANLSPSTAVNVDVDALSSKISSLLSDLEKLAATASGTSMDAVQNELGQEAALRSQSQMARHARCE